MSSDGFFQFEFDGAKNEANLAKHGIGFAQAEQLWRDPELWVEPAKFPGEPRYIAIGFLHGRHWTAVFTRRLGRVQLISLRRSRHEERQIYEEKKGRHHGE